MFEFVAQLLAVDEHTGLKGLIAVKAGLFYTQLLRYAPITVKFGTVRTYVCMLYQVLAY